MDKVILRIYAMASGKKSGKEGKGKVSLGKHGFLYYLTPEAPLTSPLHRGHKISLGRGQLIPSRTASTPTLAVPTGAPSTHTPQGIHGKDCRRVVASHSSKLRV